MAVDREDVRRELKAMLRSVWRQHPDREIDPSAPLAALGVESSTLVTFLVRIEDRFRFSWDPDLPAGTLSTLDSISDAVVDRLRLAEPAGGR